jgi:hypothetical protein
MPYAAVGPDNSDPEHRCYSSIAFSRDALCCVHDLSEALDEMQDTAKLYKTRGEPVMESC